MSDIDRIDWERFSTMTVDPARLEQPDQVVRGRFPLIQSLLTLQCHRR